MIFALLPCAWWPQRPLWRFKRWLPVTIRLCYAQSLDIKATPSAGHLLQCRSTSTLPAAVLHPWLQVRHLRRELYTAAERTLSLEQQLAQLQATGLTAAGQMQQAERRIGRLQGEVAAEQVGGHGTSDTTGVPEGWQPVLTYWACAKRQRCSSRGGTILISAC